MQTSLLSETGDKVQYTQLTPKKAVLTVILEAMRRKIVAERRLTATATRAAHLVATNRGIVNQNVEKEI